MRISDWSSDVCSSDLETRIIENSCSIFDLAQDFGLGLGNGEHKARFDEMVGHVRSSRKIGSGQSGLRPRRHVLPLPPSLLLFACAKRRCGEARGGEPRSRRSEEHTSEIQYLMRNP